MTVVLALFAFLAAAALGACGPTPPPDENAPPTGDTHAPTPEPLPAAVVAAGDAPVLDGAGGKARITKLAKGHNAFVGRLELAPGAAVPEHADTTEEYLHILEGHGTITIDGAEYAVAPGTTVFMPAGALVHYTNGDERLVCIQVFAGPAPAAKYDGWSPVGSD